MYGYQRQTLYKDQLAIIDQDFLTMSRQEKRLWKTRRNWTNLNTTWKNLKSLKNTKAYYLPVIDLAWIKKLLRMIHKILDKVIKGEILKHVDDEMFGFSNIYVVNVFIQCLFWGGIEKKYDCYGKIFLRTGEVK